MSSRLSLADGMFAPSGGPSRTASRAPAAPGKRRASPERALHIAVVAALRKALPRDALLHHSRNETNGRNRDMERIMGERMGVMPGFPDLLIIYRGTAITIELKAPGRIGARGKEIAVSKPTETQHWAHSRLQECGAPVAVCRSLDEVMAFLEQQGVPLRMRVAA